MKQKPSSRTHQYGYIIVWGFFTVRDDQPKNVNEHEFVFQQFVEYLITRKDYFYSFRTKINPL